MPLLFLADAGYLPPGPPLPNAIAAAAAAMTLADITSADWSLMLDSSALQQGLSSGIGAVVQGFQDVNQCIAIILTTPKGSDPLRPTFGCDLWQFIDTPITIATPHIVREVTEALSMWEPRIKVIAVTAKLAQIGSNSQYGANLRVGVIWQLKLGSSVPPSALQQQTTLVTITPGLTH